MTQEALQAEIDRITAAVQARGHRLDIAGGALPGETALVIDANGDAIDEPDELLAAYAQLYALLVDLRDGHLTEQQFDDMGGNVCRAIVQQSQA